eukprot:scaffold143769_cov44-Prasinocladus_malaysianus.AAC.1
MDIGESYVATHYTTMKSLVAAGGPLKKIPYYPVPYFTSFLRSVPGYLKVTGISRAHGVLKEESGNCRPARKLQLLSRGAHTVALACKLRGVKARAKDAIDHPTARSKRGHFG